MTEELPIGAPPELAIEDHRVIQRMWMMLGLMEAVQKLEDLKQQHKGAPGLSLAIATLDAHAQKSRANTLSTNLRLAAKAGVDLDRYDIAIKSDAKGTYLVFTESEEP